VLPVGGHLRKPAQYSTGGGEFIEQSATSTTPRGYGKFKFNEFNSTLNFSQPFEYIRVREVH
jgi:hypothetical protein